MTSDSFLPIENTGTPRIYYTPERNVCRAENSNSHRKDMITKLICCILLFQATCSEALQNCAKRSAIDATSNSRIVSRRYSEFTHRKSISRRHFFLKNVAIVHVGIITPHIFSAIDSANAIEVSPRETSVGEALRRSAANLPGYGPTDVFYPLSWQGTWTLQREDILTNSTFTYPIRFIQSIDRDAVIADRTFNERNYWETVQRGDRNSNIVQSIQWTETNPNDLNILFTNGLRRNVKITKRASDRTNTTVSSSEFQRILEDKSSLDGSTVPKLVSRRTLTKWKMITDNHIEGIEIIYDMNVEGDADRIDLSTSLQSNDVSRPPKLISKSRFYLDR